MSYLQSYESIRRSRMSDDSIRILKRFDECLRLRLNKGCFLFLKANSTEHSFRKSDREWNKRTPSRKRCHYLPKKGDITLHVFSLFSLSCFIFSWSLSSSFFVCFVFFLLLSFLMLKGQHLGD